MVSIENKSGAKKLVDHLIEAHGKRRIVYLKGPQGHEDSLWRERGYRLSLENHNIEFDPDLVAYGGFNGELAYSTIQQMIRNQIKMDAIFAGDDDAATGVYRALKESLRCIPDDIAVAGFDDVAFSRYISPTLTTIRAPIEEVGVAAVQLLLKCIQNIECEPTILLPTELIIRESCGCKH
jgi:DNA-binding LacI/PurR family transcriptional regulator